MTASRTITGQRSVRICGDESVHAGRGAGQLPWYEFAKQFVECRTVIDVGCGTGKGMQILREAATSVQGQDLDPRLSGADTHITSLENLPSAGYDVVTCIDVIEHVEDPAGFVRQLRRIARTGIFLTTPNWTASRCQWPYHLREYTPREFYALLATVGAVTLFKGTSSGSAAYPVRHRRAQFLLNDARSWTPTSFPARCVNRLLPAAWRIHSHNAAWVTL